MIGFGGDGRPRFLCVARWDWLGCRSFKNQDLLFIMDDPFVKKTVAVFYIESTLLYYISTDFGFFKKIGTYIGVGFYLNFSSYRVTKW